MLKPNTTYTFLWNYKHISGNDNHKVSVGYATTTSNYAKEVTTQVNSSLGTLVFTTDLLGTDDYVGISFRFLRTSDTSSEITIGEYTNLMIFEGDLTQTPELIPTEYVEGLKSSFEDNVVTQAMVDSGEESAENLGKYKVEYKVTGKNILDSSKFIKGGYYDNSGKFNNPNAYYLEEPLRVEPNTTYYYLAEDGTSAFVSYTVTYDENMEVISVEFDKTQYTTSAKAKYMRVSPW
jgi:hypothetical protein